MGGSHLNLILLALLFAGPRLTPALAQDCVEKPAPTLPNISSLAEAIGKSSFSRRGYLTPAEALATDPILLAEALVARLERECEATRPPLGRGEEFSADISMVVSSKALPFIAEQGFANQHLTNTSGGLLQTNKRLRKEEMLIGMQLPYGSKLREILPKYALLNVHRDDVGKFGVPDFYGDVSVVFNDDVKKRTTFTRADSMVRDFTDNPEEFPPRTMNHKFDTARPWQCSGYCEAQVWGPLTLRDVKHLMVQKGTVLSPDLKSLGLPIYEYEGVPTRDVTREAKDAYAKSGQATMQKIGAKIWDGGARASADPISLAEPPAAVKNIQANRALAEASTEALKQQFAELPYQPITAENPADSFSPRAKAFAEISSRGLGAGGEAFLRKGLSDIDPLVRREALLGLSDLSAAKLKPLILSKLKDKDRNVIFRAVVMAADFKGDPKIEAAVKSALKMKQPADAELAAELWKRLRQPTFCTAVPAK
ncbi:MAG: HEAT repeat domain-containing protein [Proteobacteria bacterium]|nr:MAG: HEAT repeat domain-containing protein [Pseudomonadota bacterium]